MFCFAEIVILEDYVNYKRIILKSQKKMYIYYCLYYILSRVRNVSELSFVHHVVNGLVSELNSFRERWLIIMLRRCLSLVNET